MEAEQMIACLLAEIRTKQVEVWEEMPAGHELMVVMKSGHEEMPAKMDFS